MSNTPEQTAQQRFDVAYVSGPEICKRLRISRATLLNARRRGDLPDPVEVNSSQVFIWERDAIEAALSAWQVKIEARRNAA